MTRKEFKERTAFETILADEAEKSCTDGQPYCAHSVAITAARLLCRHGKTYARIQEMNCNGPALSDYAQAHWSAEQLNKTYARHQAYCEKREQQLEKRIKTIVRDLGPGFGVVFQGDPRGATVKVTVPSGRTNDWGREGIYVPTA